MLIIKQRFGHLFADEYCHGNPYGLVECPGWESKAISFLEALNRSQKQFGHSVRVVLMSDCGTSISVHTTQNHPDVNNLIQNLKRISMITCCKCGNPGQQRKQNIDKDDCDYTYRTLCDTCGKGCPIVNV